MIYHLKIFLAYIKYAPLLFFYRKSSNKILIDKDVERWSTELRILAPQRRSLVILLRFWPQFRSVFFFRIKTHSTLLKMLCPPDKTISIADDCGDIAGGGLFFEHAFGTRINVNQIGTGCRFRQLITIGVKSKNRHNDKPWIGNNVDFGVNVICIGNIHIGDNAIIGAGSVVVKDVPENAIVAGNPAKIIKFRDINTVN